MHGQLMKHEFIYTVYLADGANLIIESRDFASRSEMIKYVEDGINEGCKVFVTQKMTIELDMKL